jgi:hypothetical protein
LIADHLALRIRCPDRPLRKRRDDSRRDVRCSIPIEPNLRPLLELLVEICPDGKPLLRVPPPEDCAELVRKDLIAAGCDREELYADDAERAPFVFHGLRHTCLTHWAVAGGKKAEAAWLTAAAGHTNLGQSMQYIDAAAVLRGRFGDPHPPLPESLIAEIELSGLSRIGENVMISATPTGIEP